MVLFRSVFRGALSISLYLPLGRMIQMRDRGNVWFKSHKILHLNKLVRDSKQILPPNFTTWQLRVLRSANLIIGNQCPFFHGLAACIVCLDVELNMSTFQRDTISKRIFLRNCFHLIFQHEINEHLLRI